MRYLIIPIKTTDIVPFYTQWYDYENNWSEKYYMIIDLYNHKYSTDGETWIELDEDHL